MANKYFLATVGNAAAFARENGQLVKAFTARTLTDSTLSFTSTMEEVRAGQGAKLYGRFNHTSGMTVALTDAMFDMNYIRLQTGAERLDGGNTAIATDKVSYDNGVFGALSNEPAALGKSCGLQDEVVWVRPVGCKESAGEEVAITIKEGQATIAGNVITVVDDTIKSMLTKGEYCVSYFTYKAAEAIAVKANFLPAELVLILTANLYQGDANSPETGKVAGTITIKVPRFQLDGQFDLSLAMAGAATMSLNGTALAVDASGCEDDGIYCEIVKVINGQNYVDGAISIADSEAVKLSDGEFQVTEGEVPMLFVQYSDGRVNRVPNVNFVFEPVLNGGKWDKDDQNKCKVTLKKNAEGDKSTVSVTFQVAAAEA